MRLLIQQSRRLDGLRKIEYRSRLLNPPLLRKLILILQELRKRMRNMMICLMNPLLMKKVMGHLLMSHLLRALVFVLVRLQSIMLQLCRLHPLKIAILKELRDVKAKMGKMDEDMSFIYYLHSAHLIE